LRFAGLRDGPGDGPRKAPASPAIIVEAGASTFVREAFDAMLDAGGALVLERKNGASPLGRER
jgi:hypothetical protein